MPAPSGVKLRESCEACASSKVKCSKDKPTCSRCDERAIPCQYFVTQKTGRKQRRRDTRNDSIDISTSCQSMAPPSSVSRCFSQPDLPTGVSISDSLFSAPDGNSNACSSLEDFMASLPMASSFPPLTPAQSLSTCSTREYTPESFSTFNFGLDQLDTLLQPNDTSLSTEALDTDLVEFAPFPTANPLQTPCDANSLSSADGLELAMQLMMQLSRQEEDLSSCSTPTPPATSPSQLDTTINRNKKVIETVSTMLQSRDSLDGYCLIVICLVISKVLSTYVVAVHASRTCRFSQLQHRPSTSSSTISGWSSITTELGSTDITDKVDPVAAQRVLQEFHNAQVSVDQLGARMELCAKRNRSFGNCVDGDVSVPGFPFSATVMEQLYGELRKRLSALSLELLDDLKRHWSQ
jgi:hypothetical protein